MAKRMVKIALLVSLFCIYYNSDAQTFTSTPVIEGTYGIYYEYNITTTAFLNLARDITLSDGILPEGIILNDLGNGTAILSGIPESTGEYFIELTVKLSGLDNSSSQNFTLTISKSTAEITLTNLNTSYNGTPQTPNTSTNPPDLLVNLTFNGSNDAPTNVGDYEVVATVDDPNYQGTIVNQFIIEKATAEISINGLNTYYDGTPKPVTINTTPAGLDYTITYDDNNEPPTAVGSYNVITTINDDNYQGQSNENLIINKGIVTFSLEGLNTVFDGNPKPVTVNSIPSGIDFIITYDGNIQAPSGAGSYTISVTAEDDNYSGQIDETLIINKQTATITLDKLNATYNGNQHAVQVSTEPPDLNYTVSYDGNDELPTNAGSYAVSVVIDETNYQGQTNGVLNISKQIAGITLDNLNVIYDGSSKPIAVATTPSNLNVTITYAGEANPPVNAGSYEVIAIINDQNYQGEVKNNLIIEKAMANITFGNLAFVFDGTPKPVSVTVLPSNLDINISYNGSLTPPSAIGVYTVEVIVIDQNYIGIQSANLVINTGVADISITNLNRVYDGNPKEVTVVTDPPDLEYQVNYNGTPEPPTNAGSYDISAFVTDSYYGGSSTATMTIEKKEAELILNNLIVEFDGSPKPVTVSINPEGLEVEITYDGQISAPTEPGNYSVTASVKDLNYYGEVRGVLIISSDPGINKKPVLTNIEQNAIVYRQGNSAVPISKTVIINDFDNNNMYEARIHISRNYIKGEDNLTFNNSTLPKLTGVFDQSSGELTISGIDSKSNYESALSNVFYGNNLLGETSITNKSISIVVNDSILDSDPAVRNITISVSPDIAIVNAFTPNGDAVNDYWDFLNLESYSEINISIYDKSGIQVFNCVHKNCKWDGTFRGRDLPSGIYLYTIALENGKISYKGTVTILR